MATLITFATYEIGAILAALIALVGYQLLTHQISTRGLLNEKTSKGVSGFSPARLQLLLFTFAVAGYVLGQVINSLATPNPHFPEIDKKWLLMLGGSHSIYLGAKGLPRILSLLNPNNKGE